LVRKDGLWVGGWVDNKHAQFRESYCPIRIKNTAGIKMMAIIQTHESTQQVQTARDRHRTEFALQRMT